jgi:hypothetical protein
MSEHDADQGQSATVEARTLRAEHVARMNRLASRVAPAEDSQEGVWARLHHDGTVEVNVYCHHDGINSNVVAAPTKALEEALRGVLERHRDALRARVGHDVVQQMTAAQEVS